MKSYFAVVLGLSPTGLYVVRELGEDGVPILGVSGSLQAGQYSKYVNLGVINVAAERDEFLVSELNARAEHYAAKGVLIPTSDDYIEFVARNREELEENYLIQGSYTQERYESIVNKGEFYQLCDEHGVAYPACVELPRNELDDLPASVRFPCILKPTLIHKVKQFMAGRKVLIVSDENEYRQMVKDIPEAETYWLVQEIVPGPESNITLYGGYFNKQGSACGGFTCTKVRQFPPGFGSASLVRSYDHDDIRQITETFMSRMGYQGIAGAEFKWDPRDQEHKIIEVNPRPTLWFSVSNAANKRIALAAFRDLTGQEAVAERPQRNDVQWRYVGKDMWSKFFYLLKGRGFVLPAPQTWKHTRRVAKRTYPVFQLSDPKPLLGELWNYILKLRSRRK